MSALLQLRKLQDSLVGATAPRRKLVEAGPFLVMLDPTSDIIYVNYAVPVTESSFGPAEIAQLVDAFQSNDRVPRLEFFRELWPTLPSALESAGFELEKENPALICTPETYTKAPPSKVEAKILTATDDLQPYYETANEAYEMDWRISDVRTERTREQIRRGFLQCAVGYVDGQAAGCACTTPFEGVCELAGVGTRPAFRRQGLASAVCSALLEDFFQTGTLAWLSAADEGSKSVYKRLGFYDAASQVNYMLSNPEK